MALRAALLAAVGYQKGFDPADERSYRALLSWLEDAKAGGEGAFAAPAVVPLSRLQRSLLSPPLLLSPFSPIYPDHMHLRATVRLPARRIPSSPPSGAAILTPLPFA